MNGTRPLGIKTYGRIPHLPGSRTGPGDRHLSPAQAARLTTGPRPGDQVWIGEKLDGTNVGVARLGAEVVPLVRQGFAAASSSRLQAQLFDLWARHHAERFLAVLRPGERLVGEWLLYAHGTRYALPHEPFVAFDLLEGRARRPVAEFRARVGGLFTTPGVLGTEAQDPAQLWQALVDSGGGSVHGAHPLPEGFVYRLERGGGAGLIAKWVRPGYVTGGYFEADEATLPNVLLPGDAALLEELAARLTPPPRRDGTGL